MKFSVKKLTALLLTAFLVLSLFSTVSFAADGIKKEKMTIPSNDSNYGYTYVPQVGNHALTEAYLNGDVAETNAVTTLPSSYDGRNYNYLPAVRNQGNYETCWTFATMASIEAYMIKHGVYNPSTGATANTNLDLSEYHLCWFNYTNAYDKKGMLTGDYTTPRASHFLNNTGLFQMSVYTLMRWEGVASESTSALRYSNASTAGLNSQYAYDYDIVHLDHAKWIPMSNRDAIKRAIMEYGAGGFGYFSYTADNTLYNPTTAGYCFKQNASSGSYSGNHAVTVVGWDDNYSKSNFKSTYGPSNNGAWIVRNSWGSSWGDGGYFYLSYEDTASYNDNVYFFAVDSVDNFDNCYQYDGTSNLNSYKAMGNNAQVANIFTASGNESLKAVSVCTWDEAVTYTVQVYKNLTTATNPTSGTLVSTQNGYFDYPGYYTVDLSSPVSLSNGDTFSVVFTLNTPSASSYDYKYIHMPYDASDSSLTWVRFTHANKGNTSYYREANGSWYDAPNYGDFRIKAYTDDRTATHTHSYGSWYSNYNGTHSRTCSCGDKQTANCTYNDVVTAPTTTSQGYTTHTCTVCGYSYRDTYTDPIVNTTYYTVTFSVPSGVSSISSQTVAANSYITLPTANAPSGYTFKGWVTSAVSNTTTMPSYLTGTYKVTGNVTLRALYAYSTSSGSGTSGYELVTSAPSNWAGKYVITYGTTTSMYLLKGVTPSSNGASIESSSNAVAYASAGVSLSNNMLTNVANAYIFTLAAHGNYYSVQNVATGTYLGMTTSYYLGGYTSYNSSYCDWTPGVGSNASSMKTSISGASYPYLSFSTSSAKFWSGSSSTTTSTTSVRLWKQTSGGSSTTTYYTTSPSGSTHTHSYGSWYSNYNGTHSRTCSCGDKQTANCTYNDVVTAPTTTSQGYTTHTCTVCGYSYRDSYTNPIDNTTYYTVSFSTPSSVSAPSSQTVAANSYITLPTANAPSGYTFKGWVTSAVSNTTTMPSYLTGTYKVTGNITLRALYAYTTTSGSGTAYELVTSAPSNWAGKYVITYGNTTSMSLLKGVTPSSNGASIESASNADTYANAGVTLSNNKLTNVSNVYVFTLAAHGSYYSAQNASTGTYLGMTSKTYVAAYNTYTATYCDWTPGTGANASGMKSAASGSFPYLSFYSSGKYFWSNSSVNTSIRLWKQTSGGSSTTYYTTG